MDPHFVFGAAGPLAILGWLALLLSLIAPAVRRPAQTAARLLIPAVLGVGYVVLLAQGWGGAPGAGFGSIEQVRALFSVDAALAAGWLHYLAFDLFVGLWIAERADARGLNRFIQAPLLFATFMFGLFVGSWIVEDGLARGINRFALIPCLALTFLFGPAGFLLYLGLRLVLARKVA